MNFKFNLDSRKVKNGVLRASNDYFVKVKKNNKKIISLCIKNMISINILDIPNSVLDQ